VILRYIVHTKIANIVPITDKSKFLFYEL